MRQRPQHGQAVRKPRQQQLVALAPEHLAHDRIRHRLGRQRGHQEGAVVAVAREQRRGGVALVDAHGAHARRAVPRRELGGQAVVEGLRGGLGRRVVDHAGHRHPGGDRRDRHDHAVVGGDHGGEELLGRPVVGEGVDVEGEADVALRGVEDAAALDDAGVVDEDGRLADGLADLGRDGGDGLGGGDVALEEVDGGAWVFVLVVVLRKGKGCYSWGVYRLGRSGAGYPEPPP